MKIIPGPASEQLGKKLAKLSHQDVVPLTFKTYPDGESYVRLEGAVQKEEVVIIQTTGPPQDTRIMQLALIVDAAKRQGAEKITAMTPYLAYARQDKTFLPGEAISIDTIARMLKAAGLDRLITVNVHQQNILEKFPFPAKTISAVPLLATYFEQKGLHKPYALAPDEGAHWLAEEASTILGGECAALEKHRDPYTGGITVKREKLDVNEKEVVIFDDVISTGGTVALAAEIMVELGASEVYAACVHPLLIGDAEKRILRAGVKEIVGTDSVPSHVSKISLAPLLSRELIE